MVPCINLPNPAPAQSQAQRLCPRQLCYFLPMMTTPTRPPPPSLHNPDDSTHTSFAAYFLLCTAQFLCDLLRPSFELTSTLAQVPDLPTTNLEPPLASVAYRAPPLQFALPRTRPSRLNIPSLYSHHNVLYYDDAPNSSPRLSFCRTPDLTIDKLRRYDL
jgi:hypothetical protein